METLMSVVIGILFAIGVYLLLSRKLLRIILGSSLIAHGANLLILTMGGLKKGGVPLLEREAPSYTDPIPQALILTAIVINFALTAFLLVLAYRTYVSVGTDDMEQMRGLEDE
ncbi:multisubunit Na+/H+ antiporter, MnhC subunit [Desulfitobacterium dichloroeliminans LMG P-21439]|uniref:Multisubunit Na+/H+ antiporter, MnhC subunit n=1 Tax=Desulfitobacterium dichloroeliminans (strain LMG P-21439 / DCA1) TaxID=871963 RepID=L0F3Q9_DESDL|nr:Na(+)/H(+) antiporter subunit C [Desulfitobacterium dichloroeliminans]AGA67700.1 multisubunit Na+/H+ antiporter, MnhC subunit [Desulfitobacterium dichloroeliminans LMG P-21439]